MSRSCLQEAAHGYCVTLQTDLERRNVVVGKAIVPGARHPSELVDRGELLQGPGLTWTAGPAAAQMEFDAPDQWAVREAQHCQDPVLGPDHMDDGLDRMKAPSEVACHLPCLHSTLQHTKTGEAC